MPGKSDEAKMAKLIRQNMAKAEQKKPKDNRRQQYDSTLPQDVEDDPERRAFFSEMKKREF